MIGPTLIELCKFRFRHNGQSVDYSYGHGGMYIKLAMDETRRNHDVQAQGFRVRSSG